MTARQAVSFCTINARILHSNVALIYALILAHCCTMQYLNLLHLLIHAETSLRPVHVLPKLACYYFSTSIRSLSGLDRTGVHVLVVCDQWRRISGRRT